MKDTHIKVAITGATGFIGSSLCDFLMQHQSLLDIRVQVPPGRSPHPQFETITGNLDDVETCTKLVKGVDCVIHLANRGFPADTSQDPILAITSNIKSTGVLLSAMEQEKIHRIIFAGSGGGIYRQPRPGESLREGSPLAFRSAYSVYKVALENLLELFQSRCGIKPVILRISNPYGPKQLHHEKQGFVAAAFRKIIERAALPIWGSLDTQKDFIFIDDVSEAFFKAICLKDLTGTFHVGSNQATSLREVVALVERVTAQKLKLEFHPLKKTDTSYFRLDYTRFREMTGWEPRTGLEDGLRKTWDRIQRDPKLRLLSAA